MGACLSKKSSKKAADEDRTPYLPATKVKDKPPPEAEVEPAPVSDDRKEVDTPEVHIKTEEEPPLTAQSPDQKAQVTPAPEDSPSQSSGEKSSLDPSPPRIPDHHQRSPRRDGPTLGPSSTPPPESEPPPKPSPPEPTPPPPLSNEYDQPVAPGQVRVHVDERPKDLPTREGTPEVTPYAVSELSDGIKTPTGPDALPGTTVPMRTSFSSFKPFATDTPNAKSSVVTNNNNKIVLTSLTSPAKQSDPLPSVLTSLTSPVEPLPKEPLTVSKITTVKTEIKTEYKKESSPESDMAIFSALKYLKKDAPTEIKQELEEDKLPEALGVTVTKRVTEVITKDNDLSSLPSDVKATVEEKKKDIINDASAISQQIKDLAQDVGTEIKTTVTQIVTSSETEEVKSNGHVAAASPSLVVQHSPAKRPHVDANVLIQPQNGIETSSVIVKTEAVSKEAEKMGVHPKKEEEENSCPEAEQEEGKVNEPVMLANLKNSIKSLLCDFTAENTTIMSLHHVHPGTRTKQLQMIERWLQVPDEAENQSRVMLVTGGSGMGKTCLAAEVCHRHADILAGKHFFCYNHPGLDHNRLRSVIMALAYRFCDVFSNYPRTLPRLDRLRDVVARADVQELFDVLLFGPFNSVELARSTDQPSLIVIDAMDECKAEEVDVLSDIIQNINNSAPDWVRLLVTCRSDNELLANLDHIPTLELKRTGDNMTDIKRYLKDPMSPFMDRISLDGGLTQLARISEGNFLCATLIHKHLNDLPHDRKIALREVEHMLPVGINGILSQIFNDFRDALSHGLNGKDSSHIYKSVLAVLTAIQEPLSLEYLSYVTSSKETGIVRDIILKDLSHVLHVEGNLISFCHKLIADWLTEPQDSGPYAVDVTQGRETLAALNMRWMSDVTDDDGGSKDIPPLLKNYALKHSIHHLTDVPKQHENLGKVLCSLRYLQAKLNVPGVCVTHVLEDYKHHHVSTSRGNIHAVALEEYLKKHTQTLEQVHLYRKFLQDREEDIRPNPKFMMQIAANYPNLERLQQNARVELDGLPWIEDVISLPETKGIIRSVGSIKAIDVSPDGQTIALASKDEDYNIRLHLYSTSGEAKFLPVDIKSLNDRIGLQAKFMPDGNNIFVGSLTTFINSRGKASLSGFDVKNIELKEKFSIECCDVSSRYFACGLNTFPWGGRSLHMCVFDMKTKKPLKTIEVLHFRFGGSAQFGIKACAVAKDKPYLCACVRQSTKNQLRIIVWNVTKWQVINSIDVNNEDITKCLFVGDQTVLLGSGVRTGTSAKNNVFLPVTSELWNFKEVSNKFSQPWDSEEVCSVFGGQEDTVVCTRWYKSSDDAVVSVWHSGKVEGQAEKRYRLRGVREVVEMAMGGQTLVFVTHDEMFMYNIDDLEDLVSDHTSTGPPPISDLCVESMAFLPRSDTLAIVNMEDQGRYSVYTLDAKQEELSLKATPFAHDSRKHTRAGDLLGQFQCFRGPGTSSEVCFPNSDGSCLIFNEGDHLKLWDRSTNIARSLPSYADLKENYEEFETFKGIKGIASTKENILAVVYGQIPFRIYLYDIRSGKVLKKLDPKGLTKKNVVTDLVFIPSSGHLIAYHRDQNHTLATWNSKTGEQISSSSLQVSYARVSPASDRLAVSVRKQKKEGSLVLRNSDNKFCCPLNLPGTWLASHSESDVEFSADGTIVVGVCAQSAICRVWNAGNGDVLQDLDSVSWVSATVDVVGMLTNTHVLLHDDRLVVLDVASGDPVAILPIDETMERKSSCRGLRLSPKGGTLAGVTSSRKLALFNCHNFTTIKRKTTLQRMKSFPKSP